MNELKDKSYPKIFEITVRFPPPLTGEGEGGGESRNHPPPLYLSPPARGGEILGIILKSEKRTLRLKGVRI